MSEIKTKKQPPLTTMASAMMRGLQHSIKTGHNPGAVGAEIVRAAARGVGIKGHGHTIHKVAG
jgi:hypothetical protein